MFIADQMSCIAGVSESLGKRSADRSIFRTAGVDLPPGCQRPGQESDRKAVLSFAAAPDVVSCASKFPQLHLVGSGIPEASQRLGKVSVPRVIKIAELAQGFRNQIFRIP